MLRRTAILTLVPLALLTLANAASLQTQTQATPAPTKSTLVKIQSQVLIKATQAHVWQVLTTSEGLAALTGAKNVEAGKTFTKVGDVLVGTAWQDAGSIVCTFVTKEKELRAAFEPATAGYLCQHRIVLEPGATGGTMLTILDRYTDDKTETVDRTAKTVAIELAARLEAFRVMVEMP